MLKPTQSVTAQIIWSLWSPDWWARVDYGECSSVSSFRRQIEEGPTRCRDQGNKYQIEDIHTHTHIYIHIRKNNLARSDMSYSEVCQAFKCCTDWFPYVEFDGTSYTSRPPIEQGMELYQSCLAKESIRVSTALRKQERWTPFGRWVSALGIQMISMKLQEKFISIEWWTPGSCQSEDCSAQLCVVV